MLLTRSLTMCAVVAVCVGQGSAGMTFMGRRKPAGAMEIEPTYQEQKQELQQQRDMSLFDSMAAVQKTMDSIEQMPSCKKVAAKDLVHSCETFQDRRDGQHATGDEQLESYQKLFAIRMTNCEQLDANEVLPNICQPLLERDLRSNVPAQHIKNCLQALNIGGTNQWVTYNRVKLEGTIMCHAMRTEANKDDLIHLHKILFSAMADVNGAVVLQKDELEALTTRFGEVGGQMREFRDALHNDNREIKAEMKGLSDELKGNMAHINEHAQDLLSAVNEASQSVIDYSTKVGSAIQLAKSQSEQTDAQLAVSFDKIAYLTQQHGYELEKFLATFHATTFDMTQSMDIANAQTSIMAGKMNELTIGLDAPLQKVDSLNAGLDEMGAKHQEMHNTVNEIGIVLQQVYKLADYILVPLQKLAVLVKAGINTVGTFSAWFVVTFIAAYLCMSFMVCWQFALCNSAAIAVFLSFWFTCIHSPIRFAQTSFANHPIFTSPAFLSVLVTGSIGAVLGGAAMRVYQSFYPSRVDLDDYPYEEMDRKV